MARLTNLHDRAELADLTALYALIVDQRDVARFDEVFTADALLDTGRGERSRSGRDHRRHGGIVPL